MGHQILDGLRRAAERVDDARWVVVDTVGPHRRTVAAGVVVVALLLVGGTWMTVRSGGGDSPDASGAVVVDQAQQLRCDAWLAELRAADQVLTSPGVGSDGPCGDGSTGAAAAALGSMLGATEVTVDVDVADRHIAEAVEVVMDSSASVAARAELFDDPARAEDLLAGSALRSMTATVTGVERRTGARCATEAGGSPCAEVTFVGFAQRRLVGSSTIWVRVTADGVTVTLDALCAGAPVWCDGAGSANRLPDGAGTGR